MAFPLPIQGMVIRYSYLWRSEQLKGSEEGRKDRPCAVVLVTTDMDGDIQVTVLPITHSPPADQRLAIEVPPATKRRLGLDVDPSWIVLTEANRFFWPGPDIRPLDPNDPKSAIYGQLPYELTENIRLKLIALLKDRRTKVVRRTT